jgi:hypothetical protein
VAPECTYARADSIDWYNFRSREYFVRFDLPFPLFTRLPPINHFIDKRENVKGERCSDIGYWKGWIGDGASD